MKIAISISELQVGDVFNGKTVVSIEPPDTTNLLLPQSVAAGWKWQIMFDDGSITTPNGNSQWLVDRKVERIEI